MDHRGGDHPGGSGTGRAQLTDQQTGNAEGVNRRHFLRFAGLGFAAGIAAMFIGNRLKGGKQAPSKLTVSEDSMFRPKDSARPQG